MSIINKIDNSLMNFMKEKGQNYKSSGKGKEMRDTGHKITKRDK